MAQYVIYTDGSTYFRDGVRDGAFVVDVAITEQGFDGEKDTDWEELNETKKPT